MKKRILCYSVVQTLQRFNINAFLKTLLYNNIRAFLAYRFNGLRRPDGRFKNAKINICYFIVFFVLRRKHAGGGYVSDLHAFNRLPAAVQQPIFPPCSLVLVAVVDSVGV